MDLEVLAIILIVGIPGLFSIFLPKSTKRKVRKKTYGWESKSARERKRRK